MRKKVLLVEDSPTDAALLKELLEKEKFEVIIADSGEEGIEKARRIKPDLVLSDLVLPDIDGFEVCRRIRELVSLSNTKVVMISVRDNPEEIAKAFNVGAHDYLIKPAFTEAMVEKIKSYIEV